MTLAEMLYAVGIVVLIIIVLLGTIGLNMMKKNR